MLQCVCDNSRNLAIIVSLTHYVPSPQAQKINWGPWMDLVHTTYMTVDCGGYADFDIAAGSFSSPSGVKGLESADIIDERRVASKDDCVLIDDARTSVGSSLISGTMLLRSSSFIRVPRIVRFLVLPHPLLRGACARENGRQV